jgi:endonuclease I/chitodextrinase
MMKKLISFYLLVCTSLIVVAQQPYYNGIDFEDIRGLELKEELATRITDTHTTLLSYTPGVWEACKATDVNPNDSGEVILLYGWEAGNDNDITNDKYRDIDLRDSGGGAAYVWNREHVYPRSLGNPPLESEGPGADAHSLRPSDRTRNSTRSNLRFADGSGNSGKVNSNGAWYPGDEWKGDVARMMMYMYVRYGNVCKPSVVGVGSNSETPDDMIDLFLEWNTEDPVSDLERARNTFHGNTSNTYAQGNRNPFIDNPFLATRIWGGDSAQDLWGIFQDGDDEAPSKPTNVADSNATTTSIDLSWTASSDNVEVTGYNVYVDGTFKKTTTATTAQISNLTPGTSYSFEIEAKDQFNNKSAKSSAINASTLTDTTPPSVPSNVSASNISGTSFKVTWTASTDDTAVTGYTIYVNGVSKGTISATTYMVTGLTISTSYAVSVSAQDNSGNTSAKSAAINATTTDGSSNGITELFFSEYVEGGGFNKALELMNASNDIISLDGYSLKSAFNGSNSWGNEIALNTGTFQNVSPNDVFVILHQSADQDHLTDNADLFVDGGSVNFNGDDVVGLFKDDELIDIIGVLGNPNNNDYAKDVTLRRKETISDGNTAFDMDEWEEYPKNTVNGIGTHTTTLSVNDFEFSGFKMYPNPSKDMLHFSISNPAQVTIYSILGETVHTKRISQEENNVNIQTLSNGLYLVNVKTGNQSITRKMIKN